MQDMTARSSAIAVTATSTVDSELTSYFADCKTYMQNNGLDLLIVNEMKYLSLGTRSVVSSWLWKHTWNMCSWFVVTVLLI